MLDDLAIMAAKGFEDTATKVDIVKLGGRMGTLEGRIEGCQHEAGFFC